MKSDSQVQHDVIAELKWEPSVHAARIGVEVKNGVVTLAGHVDTYAEKWNAERATQRVAGVKAIATELKVQLSSLHQRTDADIAETADNVLQWSSTLPTGAVKVMVEDGWVTLSGNVDWQYQKQAARESVRHLLGVLGVNDHIAIKPGLNAAVVKSDIEAALQRTAVAEAKMIRVEVMGNEVTLTGSVHNWAERETATNSAWASSGVRKVHDNMTLA
jgi:osmotically-inducible protein OsmY